MSQDKWLPPGTVEYGGLYQQQQESFRNLMVVLAAAILLVFTVLLIEFRSFNEPVAIVFGSVLALFGTVAALWITGITLNIVSILGAIIGIGIVAKNGILMLDFVQQLEAGGAELVDALVRSGHRRLRPVLMTSMAAALGMLPLAYGIGAGADMLRPLAIAVIGALCISVLLSLVATPVAYFVLALVQESLAAGIRFAARIFHLMTGRGKSGRMAGLHDGLRSGCGGRGICRFCDSGVSLRKKMIQHGQIRINGIAGIWAKLPLEFAQLVRRRFGFAPDVIHVQLSAHQAVEHLVKFSGRLGTAGEHLLANLQDGICVHIQVAQHGGHFRIRARQGRQGSDRQICQHGDLNGVGCRNHRGGVRAKHEAGNTLARHGDFTQHITFQHHIVSGHGNDPAEITVAILHIQPVRAQTRHGGEHENGSE